MIGHKRMTSRDVSVIICSRNRGPDLTECLLCIQKQTVAPGEVIVVEDITEHRFYSQKKLEQIVGRSGVYRSLRHGGHAIARNIGLKTASKEILLFMDDDVLVEPSLIEIIIESYNTYPDALGFVGKILPVKDDIFSLYGSKLLNQEMEFVQKVTPIVLFGFATIALRKKYIHKHKIQFDEKLSATEDLDFLIRLHKKGERLYFNPRIRIRHKFQDSFWAFCKRRFEYGLAYATLHKKHRHFFSIEPYLPTRKLHILLLPGFVIIRSINLSRIFLYRYNLRYAYLFPAVCYHVAIFLGIYYSKDGRALLRKSVMKALRQSHPVFRRIQNWMPNVRFQ